MARKQSLLQKAYSKQVARIKQFMRRAEKRGFVFDKSSILPVKPKSIRKSSIEKLRKITPQKMYKKSVYGGKATAGEIVKGEAGVKAERKARAQKSAETRKQRKQKPEYPEPQQTYRPDNISEDTSFFDFAVINEYKRNLVHFGQNANAELNSWLDSLIAENGRHNVAVMLNDGISSGLVVTYQIAYDTSKLHEYMSDMLDYLDADDDFKSQIQDAFEDDEDWETYD